MGNFLTMLYESATFRYNYEDWMNEGVECDKDINQTVEKLLTTGNTFKDLSNHPDIVEKMDDINGNDIKLLPLENMNEFIEDLADFIDHYIDLNKMGGKYSKLWKGYQHKEEQEPRLLEIKKYLTKIITV